MVRIPIFLFVVLPVLGAAVLLWCYLCYKVGSWLVHGLFGRRPRPVYADIPVRPAYQPPPPPEYQRPMRPRRGGGGGGAFLTLLVVFAVVLGFGSFTHQKRVSQQTERSNAEALHAKAKRVKLPRAAGAAAVAVDRGQNVVMVADADEEMVRATELPPEEDKAGWVLGMGTSREDAMQRAEEKAYDKALAYIHDNLPGVQWTPDRAYVQKYLVKVRENLPDREMEGLGKVRQVRMRVEVDPKDVQDIVKHDRHDRVEQRMGLLAKILAGIVLLCSGVAAYIRIDEYSKGYLTGWLRVAGIVTVAAAGLIFLMR